MSVSVSRDLDGRLVICSSNGKMKLSEVEGVEHMRCVGDGTRRIYICVCFALREKRG